MLQPSGSPAGTLWSRLTRPHPSLQQPGRRRAQTLASLLLVLVPAAAIVALVLPLVLRNPLVEALVVGLVAVAAGAYVLSRTRGWVLAALLTLATPAVAILADVVVSRESDHLFFLVFPILLGSLFLSPRAMALVAGSCAAAALCLPPAVGALGLLQVIPAASLLGLAGALAIVGALRQEQDLRQIERQSQALKAENLRLEHAQQALSASRAQLSNLLENAAEAIIALDADQNIIVFNAGAEKVFGYSAAEVLGQPLDRLLPERFAQGHRQHVDGFSLRREAGRSMARRTEVVGRRKDGSEFPAEVGISMYLEGELLFSTAVLVDITQRRQHEREIEGVAVVSTALRRAQTRAEMLPILLEQVEDLLHTPACGITLRDTTSGEPVIALGRGNWAAATGEPRAEGHGLSALVIESGQTYWNNQLRDEPRLGRPDLLEGLQAAAIVPLIAREQTFGALWIGKGVPINVGEVSLLTAIAEMAASAIHRVMLHEQTERRLQRLTVLHAIDVAISGSLDVHLTLNVLLDEITNRLGIDAADVLLLNPHLPLLEYAAGRGFRTRAAPRGSQRLGEGEAGLAALERRVIYLPQLSAAGPPAPAARWAGEGFVTYYGAPLITAGQVVGVLEIFQRSPLGPDLEWSDFLEALSLQAAIAIKQATLYDSLQRSNAQLAVAYDATIEGWSRALDLRDHETEGHTQRVTALTLRLARALGFDEAELVHLRRGSLLHDIGKMGIPDPILLKPGPLSADEWDIMRRHPAEAFTLLAPIDYLKPALAIPYSHHEKWDGTGYPRGLKGEAIPLAARIFAVADVWDALCSDRPYRAAWPIDQVRAYMRDQAGQHFDPQVVAVFLSLAAADDPPNLIT